jgi:Spy/CpxP family protein refolding chaperone
MRQIANPPLRHERGTLRHLTAITLVLALAGATADVAQAQPMGGMGGKDAAGMPHGSQRASHHPHGGPGDRMMSERLLDAVGASDEQKTRVRDILKASRDEQRSQHEAGRALHQQMMQLLAAPQIDAAAAEALRQQQLARHDAASKRRLQAMLDVQAVLTPEQRVKLAAQMKTRQDMMERHQRERPAMPMPAPRS